MAAARLRRVLEQVARGGASDAAVRARVHGADFESALVDERLEVGVTRVAVDGLRRLAARREPALRIEPEDHLVCRAALRHQV